MPLSMSLGARGSNSGVRPHQIFLPWWAMTHPMKSKQSPSTMPLCFGEGRRAVNIGRGEDPYTFSGVLRPLASGSTLCSLSDSLRLRKVVRCFMSLPPLVLPRLRQQGYIAHMDHFIKPQGQWQPESALHPPAQRRNQCPALPCEAVESKATSLQI